MVGQAGCGCRRPGSGAGRRPAPPDRGSRAGGRRSWRRCRSWRASTSAHPTRSRTSPRQGTGRVVRVRQGHRRIGLCEPEPLAHDGTWFSDGMTLPRALDLEDTTGAADHPIQRGWMQHQVLQRIGPARSGFVELELLCRRQSARRVDGTRPRREPHRAVLELADAVDVPEPDPVRFGVRGSSRGSTSSTRSISRRSRPRPLGRRPMLGRTVQRADEHLVDSRRQP